MIFCAVSADLSENVIIFVSSDNTHINDSSVSSLVRSSRAALILLGDNATNEHLNAFGSHNNSYPSDSVLAHDTSINELVARQVVRTNRRESSSGVGGDAAAAVDSIFRSSGNNNRSANLHSQPARPQGQYEIIYDYLKIIGPLVTLTAVCAFLAFYHHFERVEAPKYLLINVFFFTVSAIFFFTNIYLHVILQSLTLFHVKVLVNTISAISTVGLTCLHIHSVIYEVKFLLLHNNT